MPALHSRAKKRLRITAALPPQTHPSLSKSGWAEFREWANVAAAVGSLLVGAVAFWTTARISGLEDYLKSEIGRRNNELNSLSGKALGLEKVADARAERLSELQTSTDLLTVASIDAQRRFSETQNELNHVRYQVTAAERSLDRTLHDQGAAKAQLSEQTNRFDLFKKRQTYQTITLLMTFQSLYEGESENELTGVKALEALQSFRPSAGDEQLLPYFARVKENFPKVCPHFRVLRPDLPKVTQKPGTPSISYRQGASRSQIAALTKEAQDEWSRKWSAWLDSSRAKTAAQIEWMKRVQAETEVCACRALADETHTEAMICPTARAYTAPLKVAG